MVDENNEAAEEMRQQRRYEWTKRHPMLFALGLAIASGSGIAALGLLRGNSVGTVLRVSLVLIPGAWITAAIILRQERIRERRMSRIGGGSSSSSSSTGSSDYPDFGPWP